MKLEDKREGISPDPLPNFWQLSFITLNGQEAPLSPSRVADHGNPSSDPTGIGTGIAAMENWRTAVLGEAHKRSQGHEKS
jgi:hypothetical protein